MIVARLRAISLLKPLAARDFRLLWVGEVISVLGDQFYLVAVPWLVLQITGSALAVGTVLMVAGIPRAVLMLLGGVLSDRFPPRTIFQLSNLARGILVSLMAWQVWTGNVALWEIYLLVFLFGVADAFSLPAFTTLVGVLVDRVQLPAANGLLQGTAHLSMFVGPAIAGVVIAAGGYGTAFAIDAASFFFILAMLMLMRTTGRRGAGEERGRLAREIAEGFRCAWHDTTTRALLVFTAVANLAITGPFMVGLATLADRRFGGAADYGTMLSAVGGGALLGSFLAGLVGHRGRRGLAYIVVTVGFGTALGALGFAPDVRVASVLTGLMGLGAGFINVLIFAWLQARTPPAMLGRVMSLVMFASVGLQPISYAAAGVVADADLTLTFGLAGALILASGLAGAATRAIRKM
jgi:MFS family permease